MSEDSLEKIMKDLFENYAIKCLVKDKNGNTKIPGYCNPRGYYLEHKEKPVWKGISIQALRQILNIKPDKKMIDDLNEFCNKCTKPDLNTADGRRGAKIKRHSKKRGSKKRSSKKRGSKKRSSKKRSSKRKYKKA